MRDPARAYREQAVRGASPVGLVVVLYEEIIRSLRRALDAVQRNQIERRTTELGHAIIVIGYLQSVLDYEKGGQIARSLCSFYNTARTKILRCSGPDAALLLEPLAAEFSSIAEAWQQVDRELSQQEEQQEPELVSAGAISAPVMRASQSHRPRASR